MNETLHGIREQTRLLVNMGFDTPHEILKMLEDDFRDEIGWDERQAKILIQGMMYAHQLKSEEWNYTTDCDRLDEAFAELDRNGIIARHDYHCCQTCGHTEMGLLMQTAREKRTILGYVFYHRQDTESALTSDYLYLAYGASTDNPKYAKVIAHTTVQTLKRHGLDATWNGQLSERISIDPIHWQRRRVPVLFNQS